MKLRKYLKSMGEREIIRLYTGEMLDIFVCEFIPRNGIFEECYESFLDYKIYDIHTDYRFTSDGKIEIVNIVKAGKVEDNTYELKENHTRCDNCPHIEKCKEERRLIDCTCSWDMFSHYTIGFGESCPLEEIKEE